MQEYLINTGQVSTDIKAKDNTALSSAIAAHYRSSIPSDNGTDALSISLQNLRKARNKSIAHNEADPLARTGITWGDAEPLIHYIKEFLIVISRGFLNVDFADDENNYFHMGVTADTTLVAMKLLLRDAKIDNPREKRPF